MNPYLPAGSVADLRNADAREPRKHSRLLWMALIAGVYGFVKWWIPPLLGTGEAYTLGIWLEEWAMLLLLGFVSACLCGWRSWQTAAIYFGVAYLLHLPLFLANRYVGVVIIHVGICAYIFLVGMAIGVSLRELKAMLSRRHESGGPDEEKVSGLNKE